jgi:hypothetical protein
MRSGLVNVICITFGGFTLPNQFPQAFEAVTDAINWHRAAFNSPYYRDLYTKPEVKANPLGTLKCHGTGQHSGG